MRKQGTQLFVDTLHNQRIVEGIFRRQIRDGWLRVTFAMTASGALSSVASSLFNYPEDPVALLVNTNTEDPMEIEEMRGSAERILARTAPLNWCVALAIPKLDAWAMTDPRIRKAIEENKEALNTYRERALAIQKLTETQPFDAAVLRRECEDFRRLEAFIREHNDAKVETR